MIMSWSCRVGVPNVGIGPALSYPLLTDPLRCHRLIAYFIRRVEGVASIYDRRIIMAARSKKAKAAKARGQKAGKTKSGRRSTQYGMVADLAQITGMSPQEMGGSGGGGEG